MKPPSPTALSQAKRILLDSISKQNPDVTKPSGDRDGPPQLQHQIDMLETAVKAISHDLTEDLTRCKRDLNSFVAVHQLPVEVLTKILQFDIASYPSSNSQPLWPFSFRQHTLASVCALWGDIIRGTPACWADICLGRDPVDLFLRKSKQSPLDLIASSSFQVYSWQNRDMVREFMESVHPQAHRWRSLELMCDSSLDVSRWFQAPTPLLRDLRVRFIGAGWGKSDTLRFMGEESFRNVSLKGAYMAWDSPRLSGLETLELTELSQRIPTPRDLHAILSSSPRLRDLRFSSWQSPRTYGLNFHEDETPIHSPVDLPALNTLILSSIPRKTWEFLLSNIKSAPLNTFQLSKADDPDFIVTKEGPPAFHHLMAPVFSRSRPLTIVSDVTQGDILISQEGNGIRFPTYTPYKSLQHVATFFNTMTITAPISISVVEHGVPNSGRGQPKNAFPLDLLELSSIVLLRVDYLDDAIQVLERLAERRTGTGSDSAWLCPKLETLDLSNVKGLKKAAVSNFRRYRADPNAEGNSLDLRLPSKLV